MALEIRIVTVSNAPIYRQIADQVRKAVASGVLAPGDQLPSVRALAELLVINPNTVARAYADLMHEGVLHSQPGKGLFVARRHQKFSQRERRQRLERALEVFLHEVLFLDFSAEEITQLLRQKLTELSASAETGSAPRQGKPQGEDAHG